MIIRKPRFSSDCDGATGPSWSVRAARDLQRNRSLYLMVIPVLAFYLIFHYRPMYGAIIAFKDFNPMRGISGSPYVGFKHFQDFFSSFYFGRILRNTLTISISSLVFGFPAPLILALLLNEVQSRRFARVVQTISYMPHFISLVVICGLIRIFVAQNGLISILIGFLGGDQINMLMQPRLFVPIYVISGIWQGVGWGSIIYLAAIASINGELYEAACIDGAGRFSQAFHITLPGIMPTVIILLILNIGGLMNVGFEKIILLYNPAIYETADVISSFVYRKGLMEFNWSYSSAVGIFNSVANFALLLSANKLSRKFNETSLW